MSEEALQENIGDNNSSTREEEEASPPPEPKPAPKSKKPTLKSKPKATTPNTPNTSQTADETKSGKQSASKNARRPQRSRKPQNYEDTDVSDFEEKLKVEAKIELPPLNPVVASLQVNFYDRTFSITQYVLLPLCLSVGTQYVTKSGYVSQKFY